MMSRLEFVPPPRPEPVAQYLAQIRRVRALEARQEYDLAKRWREHDDGDAEHRLVTSQLRLVAKIAWGYRTYGLPFSKLICAGNRGLVDAVKQFDPDRGIRLTTYATWRIQSAIVRCLLGSWAQGQGQTTAEKRKLLFDLCRLKSHLAALSERELSREAVDRAVVLSGRVHQVVSKDRRRLS
jgi:RNA polymerase sigma-32 factor